MSSILLGGATPVIANLLGSIYGEMAREEKAKKRFFENAKPVIETVHTQRITQSGDTLDMSRTDTVAYVVPAAKFPR